MEYLLYWMQFTFKIDDLKARLRRRGPDSLGTKKVILEVKDAKVHSYVVREDEETESEVSCLRGSMHDCKPLANGENGQQSVGEMYFVGAVLQLRGTKPVVQPLVDASGNILIYNGNLNLHISLLWIEHS